MRTGMFVLMGVVWAGTAQAGWNDYEEIRELALDAQGVASLRVDAGAGRLEITGTPGLDRIEVVATVTVPGADEDDGKAALESDLALTLSLDGTKALLVADFDRDLWDFGDSPRIDLEIRVPAALAVDIEDGSGSISVAGLESDLRIEDGSGSIEVRDIGGSVDIEDGSGSIDVHTVRGDLRIDDGSGSIKANGIGGSVTVDDGSGSVTISDVGQDLVILDDGSGSLSYTNVRGRVDDRS